MNALIVSFIVVAVPTMAFAQDGGVPDGTAVVVSTPTTVVSTPPVDQSGAAMQFLLALMCYGLGMFFFIETIRNIRWPKEWAEKRPLSCNLCLTFWVTLALALVLGKLAGVQSALQLAPAAGGLCMLFLSLHAYLRGPTFTPPGG